MNTPHPSDTGHAAPHDPYAQPRPVRLELSCLNMRHKLMYCDERHAVRGTVDPHSSTRVFFCIKTCDVLGPDEKPVHPQDCHSGRGCFCDPTPATGSPPAQWPSALRPPSAT